MRNLCFVTKYALAASWVYVIILLCARVIFCTDFIFSNKLSYLNNVDKALKEQNSFKFIIIIDF